MAEFGRIYRAVDILVSKAGHPHARSAECSQLAAWNPPGKHHISELLKPDQVE